MSENLEQLQALAHKKSAVEWFGGLFKRVHLEIADTGEKFTIIRNAEGAEVVPGFQQDKPNFVITLESDNIRRLTAVFSDDAVDAQEEYRIVKAMLKPCLRAVLDMGLMGNKTLMDVVKVDKHWQEALLDPEGNEDEKLTVVYVNRQWLIIPGYYGRPQRRWRLTPRELLDFQRRVFAADEAGNFSAWLDLARWYVGWRKKAAATVAA